MQRWGLIFLGMLLITGLAACGIQNDSLNEAESLNTEIPLTNTAVYIAYESTAEALDKMSTATRVAVGDSVAEATAAAFATPEPALATATPEPAIAATAVPGTTATLVPTRTALPAAAVEAVEAIPLNAGEIDDNADWDDYLTYRANYLNQRNPAVHDLDVSQRQIITVSDEQGMPVLGARVIVQHDQTTITESRTYANGQTLFFPGAWTNTEQAQAYRVIVQQQDAAVEFTLDPQAGQEWAITLSNAAPLDNAALDVVFLLDATGSMGDEIRQLQSNILAISSAIDQLPGEVNVRYGLVTYRDRGDEYVTRAFDFVPDVNAFQASLSAVYATGGGDTPESLNEGLHVAIHDLSWRADDTIKLIFLVADAAPHLDYPNDYDYSQEMVAATWHGIKIHPIASSGLTPQGEYIFRQLAQYTLGHFLFLTYEQGVAGTPGDERPDLAAGSDGPGENEENYSVDQLDELVLRLITDELAARQTPVDTARAAHPALASVPPLPTADSPSAFALAQARRYVPPSPPASASGEMAAFNIEDQTVTVQQAALVGGLCLIVGYALNAQRRLRKKKRRINAIYAPADEE